MFVTAKIVKRKGGNKRRWEKGRNERRVGGGDFRRFTQKPVLHVTELTHFLGCVRKYMEIHTISNEKIAKYQYPGTAKPHSFRSSSFSLLRERWAWDMLPFISRAAFPPSLQVSRLLFCRASARRTASKNADTRRHESLRPSNAAGGGSQTWYLAGGAAALALLGGFAMSRNSLTAKEDPKKQQPQMVAPLNAAADTKAKIVLDVRMPSRSLSNKFLFLCEAR